MISSLELARLCGVSQGTVDRALHDRPGISARTRERILAAAEAHGYRPNPAVREVLDGRSRQVVGLVPGGLSIFFMDLMNALAERLSRDGWRLLMVPVSEGTELLSTLEEFASRRVAGAVIVPPRRTLTIPPKVARHLPVATLVGKCGGAGVCHIAPDEVVTGRTAVDTLAGLGHRRIVHLTYPSRHSAVIERRQGYEDRLAELGLPACVVEHGTPGALAAALQGFEASAIFCHNDWLALSAMRQLHDLGVDVPGAISVLGVDNSPSFNELCPAISTLAYPMAAVAEATSAWLREGVAPPAFGPLQAILRDTTRAR